MPSLLTVPLSGDAKDSISLEDEILKFGDLQIPKSPEGVFSLMGNLLEADFEDANQVKLKGWLIEELAERAGPVLLKRNQDVWSFSFSLPENGIKLPLLPGQLDARIVADEAVLELNPVEGGTQAVFKLQRNEHDLEIDFGFSLFGFSPAEDPVFDDSYAFEIPLAPSGGSIKFPNRPIEATLKLTDQRQIKLLKVDMKSGASGTPDLALPPMQWDLSVGLAPTLFGFAGQLFEDLGVKIPAPELVFPTQAVQWDGEQLVISGVGLRFPETHDGLPKTNDGFHLELQGAALRLDKRLQLIADDAGRIVVGMQTTNSFPLLKGEQNPFTVVFHKRQPYELVFDNGIPSLSTPGNNSAVASVYVPGIGDTACGKVEHDPEYDGGDIAKRFVLDVLPAGGDGKSAVSISAGGARFRAKARRRAIQIGPLEESVTSEGELLVEGRSWSLNMSGQARLPYFENSYGTLHVRGGNGPESGASFAVAFETKLGVDWTDPSGILTVDRIRVYVGIIWKKGSDPWDVEGDLGGRIVFNPAPMVDEAGAWVSGLFSGNSIEFDGLKLDGFKDKKTLSLKDRVKLNLKDQLEVSLWDVFNFKIDNFELLTKTGAIGLGGKLTLNLGAVRFGGRLPSLNISLKGGIIRLALEEAPISISGHLETKGGVKAQLSIGRVRTKTEELLTGTGSLSTPSIPGIAVLAILGRFRNKANQWLPTITLYAQGPVTVAVYPGLVIREIGVGFGIYSVLDGIDQIADGSVSDAVALLEGKNGQIPDPGQLASWRRDEKTIVSLVGRSIVTPDPATPASEPSLYVGDMVLSLDSQFRFAAFGRTWVLTSIEDAKTKPFQDRPAARGLLVVDAKEPSLIAVYQTLKNPATSLGESLGGAGGAMLSGALGAVQTRMTFEARHRMFALTVGPTGFDERLGPIAIRGQTLFGVRASPRGAHAMVSLAAAADFQTRLGARIGLASFGVSLHAGFSLDAILFGGMQKRQGTQDKQLALYGQLRLNIYAELGVFVKIEFRIRIRAGFIKITISFSRQWTLHISIHIGLDVQTLISSQGLALKASGQVSFRVLGIGFSAAMTVSGGSMALLEDARTAAAQARSQHLLLS